MGSFEDLTGRKFGRLTVISFAKRERNRTYWNCKCECGKELLAYSHQLKRGDKRSCGCLRAERGTNPLYDSKLYKVWRGVVSRCHTKTKGRCYKYYGKRKIKVCDEWRHDFMSFYNWAMSNGYEDGLTIDRIDNNKGYSPDNCRWATWEQQVRNRTDNKWLTYNGRTMIQSDWAEELQISKSSLRWRLEHWGIEKALSTPKSPNR